MKKILLSFALFLFSFSSLYSKPVSLETAKTVAVNYFTHFTGKSVSSITLTYTEKNADRNLYYAFTINSTKGFILIAADDRSAPILGYSSESGFVIPTNRMVAVGNWLKNYANEVNYIVVHDLKADAAINQAWAAGVTGDFNNLNNGSKKNSPQNVTAVTPLLTCAWNQDPYVNDACPYDSTDQQLTVTGCPATAMAQIMKKWAYPTIGYGQHQYSSKKYGTLSANFGATTYNWSNMPDTVNAANSDVAQLMFHIGVAVEMEYGTTKKPSDGSGAYVRVAGAPSGSACCEIAFKTYFGYDSTTLRGLSRADFKDNEWVALLKADLDSSRPMQYEGSGAGGGHTWVCDGYDASDNFHMNWGWGGTDDSYYPLTKLNPGIGGAGAGDGDFNGDQGCLLGIQPIKTLYKSTPPQVGYLLADSIQINPNPVAFSQGFTATTKITNKNKTDFSGSISARLFDQNGRYITEAPILANQTIAAGATTDILTFNVPGVLDAPGKHTVGIYISDNGKDWTLARPGNFADPVTIMINGPTGSLTLASTIELAPMVTGKPSTVKANFKNNYPADFKGIISADIYNIAGKLIQNIGSYTESNGLASGASYAAALVFSSASISAAPGTYLIALTYKTNAGDSGLCGGGFFTNPDTINITAPVLLPDMYEPNNSADSAYTFNPVFTGGMAEVMTTGANIQNGLDLDFYKVNFPPGFKYTVSTILHTIRTDPSLYTLDAVVTIGSNGDGSATYSDTVSPPTVLADGGTLLFQVAAMNEGGNGTYLLQINAVQSTLGVQENIANSHLTVYPNPANTVFYLSEDPAMVNSLEIINTLGVVVKKISRNEILNNGMKIDVGNLSEGIYLLTMNTGSKIQTLKLVIAR